MLGLRGVCRPGRTPTQPQDDDADDPGRRPSVLRSYGYERDDRVIPNSTPHRTPGARRVRRSVAALGALAAVAAGMAVASPSAQAADPSSSNGTSTGSDPASRERAFAAASAEYGVPRTVLAAVSYAQTRWDVNPGHSTSGGYGPLHLVDADLGTRADAKGLGEPSAPEAAPVADTLGRAAELTGLAEDALRTDEVANIRGGAALLVATQKRLGLPTGPSTDAGQWYAAVADASGSAEQDVAARS